MTDFKDRERGEEAHFTHEEEMAFRISARRNRLLANWAAAKMDLSPEETDAYAKEVVHAAFEGSEEDVLLKVLGDLTSAGCDFDEPFVRAVLEEQMIEARRQLMGGV